MAAARTWAWPGLHWTVPSGNRSNMQAWEPVNDDDDPLHIHWSAFGTESVDRTKSARKEVIVSVAGKESATQFGRRHCISPGSRLQQYLGAVRRPSVAAQVHAPSA